MITIIYNKGVLMVGTTYVNQGKNARTPVETTLRGGAATLYVRSIARETKPVRPPQVTQMRERCGKTATN